MNEKLEISKEIRFHFFDFLLFKASLYSRQQFIVNEQFYYTIVKRFVFGIYVNDRVHVKTDASVYCKKYAVMTACIGRYFLHRLL